MDDALPCHVCGYDLRATPADGRCPECGASVAEATEFNKVPRRPAWRDSDPRWRRRMVAGVWVLLALAFMPLLPADRIPVPQFPGMPDRTGTLADSLAFSRFFRPLYEPGLFLIGAALLFARERGRRAGRLDWTRRWGLFAVTATFLYGWAVNLLTVGLVMVGIAALFHSLPLENQPPITRLFALVGAGLIDHGPHGAEAAWATLLVLPSIVVLLACVPLYEALNSTDGRRWMIALVLLPLTATAAVRVVAVGWEWLTDIDQFLGPPVGIYFFNSAAVAAIVGHVGLDADAGIDRTSIGWTLAEGVKLLVLGTIAVWLTTDQVLAWRHASPADAGVGEQGG